MVQAEMIVIAAFCMVVVLSIMFIIVATDSVSRGEKFLERLVENHGDITGVNVRMNSDTYIKFTDGTVFVIFNNGSAMAMYADGSTRNYCDFIYSVEKFTDDTLEISLKNIPADVSVGVIF